MARTTTTLRLVVDESQTPIYCFVCQDRAEWAVAAPRASGLYEMQPFCHLHFLKLPEQAERTRRRIAQQSPSAPDAG